MIVSLTIYHYNQYHTYTYIAKMVKHLLWLLTLDMANL